MTLRSPFSLCRPAAALAALLCLAAPAGAAEDFSPAERALFMTNQLTTLKPPATLNYSFSKAGSMEEAFDDKVSIRLKAKPDGKCCAAAADFLGGPRNLDQAIETIDLCVALADSQRDAIGAFLDKATPGPAAP